MNSRERLHQMDLECIKDFVLFDDEFFGVVFENNCEAAELLLNIIFDRDDMKVTEVICQREIKSIEGHSVRLDISAEDSEHNLYDVEIQRDDREDLRLRARYYSSLLDTTLLKKREPYSKLIPTYVIFLTEHDFIGDGKPLHHYMMQDVEDGAPLGDNRHIYFVNGDYKNEDSRIGRLMHDFKCKSAGDMYYDVLANRVEYFKETEGGNVAMSRTMESIAKRATILGNIDAYLETGFSEHEILERIIKKFDLTQEEAEAYIALSKELACA